MSLLCECSAAESKASPSLIGVRRVWLQKRTVLAWRLSWVRVSFQGVLADEVYAPRLSVKIWR
jgi:hypothetical protein